MKKTISSLIVLAVMIFTLSSQTFALLPTPIPSPGLITLTPFNKSHQVEFEPQLGIPQIFTVLTMGNANEVSLCPSFEHRSIDVELAVGYGVIDPTTNEVTSRGLEYVTCDNGESCNEISIPLQSYFAVTYIAVCPLYCTVLPDPVYIRLEMRLRP